MYHVHPTLPAQAMKDGTHVLKYPRSDHFCNIVEGFASLVSHIGVLFSAWKPSLSLYIPRPPAFLSQVQWQSSSEKHTKMGWVIFWAQDTAHSSGGTHQCFPNISFRVALKLKNPDSISEKFTDFNLLRHPSSSHLSLWLSSPYCLQHKGQFAQGHQAIDSFMGPWANRSRVYQLSTSTRPEFPSQALVNNSFPRRGLQMRGKGEKIQWMHWKSALHIHLYPFGLPANEL